MNVSFYTIFYQGYKMRCRGICTSYKTTKPTTNFSRYLNGHKRSQVCGIFIRWGGVQGYKCCGFTLRTNPRSLKYKAKLRMTQKEQKSPKPQKRSEEGIRYDIMYHVKPQDGYAGSYTEWLSEGGVLIQDEP